jgi:hypothetical protein
MNNRLSATHDWVAASPLSGQRNLCFGRNNGQTVKKQLVTAGGYELPCPVKSALLTMICANKSNAK